jgi:RHS repeat-associated protein
MAISRTLAQKRPNRGRFQGFRRFCRTSIDNPSNANLNLPDPTKPKFEFNLRFPGQYFDSETNLHYNYFRDYSPQTGRYQQSDPIGMDGLLRRAGVLGKGAPDETDSSFSFNPFIDVPDPLLLMIGIVDANQSTGNVVSTNLYAYADGMPLSIADPFGLAPSRGATDS